MLDRCAIALLRPALEAGARGAGARRRRVPTRSRWAGFAIGVAGGRGDRAAAVHCWASRCCWPAACSTGWTARSRGSRSPPTAAPSSTSRSTSSSTPASRWPSRSPTRRPTRWPRRCCWPPSSAPARPSSPIAALAAQRGQKSVAYPTKGLYYLGGLTEATETLACFALMCLWPQHFAAVRLRLRGAVRADHRDAPVARGWRGAAAAEPTRTPREDHGPPQARPHRRAGRPGRGVLRLRPRALPQPGLRQAAPGRFRRAVRRAGRRW